MCFGRQGFRVRVGRNLGRRAASPPPAGQRDRQTDLIFRRDPVREDREPLQQGRLQRRRPSSLPRQHTSRSGMSCAQNDGCNASFEPYFSCVSVACVLM